MRWRVESIVLPVATHPGKSGTEARQSLSGSLLMRTRYRSLLRTFTRLQHQMHNPRPLFGAAEPECSLMKPHRQCRAFETPEAPGQGADWPTRFALTRPGSWGTVRARRCHSALRREHRGPISVADARSAEPLRPPARARPGDARLPW